MSNELKLIFDECLSAPVVEAMRPLLEKSGVTLTAVGIVEKQKSGVSDSVWIPKIAAEGHWIVISSDRGKHRQCDLTEKLPHLCRVNAITHILLSARVHELKLFQKAQAVIAVWQDILLTRDAPAGSRFILKKRSSSDGYRLVSGDTDPKKYPPKDNLFDPGA